MNLTTKTLAIVLACITLWSLLFAAPGLYNIWKDASVPAEEILPPILAKTKTHTWTDKDGDSAIVEWKIVVSNISGLKKNEAENQRKIFVSGTITNKQKKAIKVSHLSLQLVVEGVELYSHPLAISAYSDALRIDPDGSKTLHFTDLVERDILSGLIYGKVDLSARIAYTPLE